MENIKAIIFDFGGVILDLDFKKLNRSFAELGVTNFEEMYSQKKADPLFERLEEGKITEAEFYDAFRRTVGINLTDDQIKNGWNTLLVSYREKALNTLAVLKNKYRLYMLSNTNSIHLGAFRKIYQDQVGKGSLADHFDKIYYSHEMGYRKPGKEIYEHVLRENNLSPAETLFIDDTISNIEGAKQAGLQTIHLVPPASVIDLKL